MPTKTKRALSLKHCASLPIVYLRKKSRILLRNLLFVGLGGAVGSILRYLISLYAGRYLSENFPWGTFLANFAGCFVIGMLIGYFDRQQLAQPDMKLLLLTGFCGGFTTFSAFAAENVRMLIGGHVFNALLYICISVFICLIAVWAGMKTIG